MRGALFALAAALLCGAGPVLQDLLSPDAIASLTPQQQADVLRAAGAMKDVRRVYYWGFHNNDPAQLFQSSLAFNRVMETPPWEPPPLVASLTHKDVEEQVTWPPMLRAAHELLLAAQRTREVIATGSLAELVVRHGAERFLDELITLRHVS